MISRWQEQGGYKEVLRMAAPLILSTGSWSLQIFVDRVFLSWYGRDALAACLPAGMLQFTFSSLFIGTVAYVNTFVAQYWGAGRPDRVGPAVWQGIYLGLASGVMILCLIPFSELFFVWAGHEPQMRALEAEYFRILCFMGPGITGVAVSSFFSGRGDTRTVMWVNFLANGLNIVLDYAWIFGHWGFPEWGIRGAAWATVVSHLLIPVVFFALMMRPRYRDALHTLSGWRPEGALLRRLVRYGLPNGVQFMLEILGFTMFILLVGKLGTTALAATSVTFNVNTLAFLPMMGLGIAVSTLVGQYLGKERADLAERCTWSAVHLSLAYMLVMAAGYVFVPGLFLRPYISGADPEAFEQVWDMSVVLLRFVAFYCVFDALYIVFSAGVKGAGDTRFVLLTSVALGWLLMVLPTYLSIVTFRWGLYVAWIFISLYLFSGGLIFMFRFRGGKWKSMRVIEGSEDTRTRGSRQSDYDNANNEVQQSRPMNHGDEVSLDAQ
jgi:MATE family multidrug resistance protein